MRGDRPRVIVEEFVGFDNEITLLTVATRTASCSARRSAIARSAATIARAGSRRRFRRRRCSRRAFQARKVVEALGGHGLFGVEFFVDGDQAIFSELSPRPHDTGMVTLISQFPNQFELHPRAILGLPIPPIALVGPSASAVILADRESDDFRYEGLADALALGAPGSQVDLRIFGKPVTLKHRRMGVALARGETVDDAVARATAAASRVQHSLSRLKELRMSGRASSLLGLSRWRPLTASGDSRAANQPDQGRQRGAEAAAPARCDQPRDRPQARDLRCRLCLQAGDRRGLCRDLAEPRRVDRTLRLRQRHIARLGDLRRSRRQRSGARLQGCGRDGLPACVVNSARKAALR